MERSQGITGVAMRPGAARRRRAAAAIAAALGVLGGSAGPDAPPPGPPPAPACRADDSVAEAAAPVALIERLRRSPPKRTPGAAVVESLDNRGYAYGAPPHPLADLPRPEPR